MSISPPFSTCGNRSNQRKTTYLQPLSSSDLRKLLTETHLGILNPEPCFLPFRSLFLDRRNRKINEYQISRLIFQNHMSRKNTFQLLWEVLSPISFLTFTTLSYFSNFAKTVEPLSPIIRSTFWEQLHRPSVSNIILSLKGSPPAVSRLYLAW